MPNKIIRIPTAVANIVLFHPELRFRLFLGPMRGYWVQDRGTGDEYFELHNTLPEDAEEFMRLPSMSPVQC